MKMTSKELRLKEARALDAYTIALDREMVSKKAALAARENYERCRTAFEESLLEKD